MVNFFLSLIVLFSFATNLQSQNKATISSAEINFIFVSKDVDGSISGFESASVIDHKNLENSKLKGSVVVETLKTGNFLRDWSLKGNKYFDADDHPKITFESTNIVPTANGYKVNGKLNMKGISKNVTFRFIHKEHQLIGEATIYSSDFDIKIKTAREDNEVKVQLVFDLKL